MYREGIPHWTDGELTLPIMAGGIDWEKYANKAKTKKKPPPRQKRPLSAYGGRFLYDAATGVGGVLVHGRRGRHGQPSEEYYVLRNPETNEVLANVQPGSTLFDPDNRKLVAIADFGNINESTASQDDIDYLFGGGDRGGGGGRASAEAAAMSPQEDFHWWKQQQDYAAQLETQQQAEARAYEAEQDRLNREYQAEQERQQREWEAQQAEIERQNRLRLQRLGDLTQLVGQFAGIQARARETLAGLQGDPFAFAGAKLGLAPSGVTPMQAFSGELSNFAGRSMPQVDPNAPLSAIEQQIMGLQGTMAPQAPKIFGMAGGGEVRGGPQTVLVGEAGPEVVIGSDFKVLPLTGSGATGYDTSTLLPALSPLYAGLGLGKGTRAGTYPTGFTIERPHGMTASSAANALGYNPRLLRSEQSQEVYYRTPEGQLQRISTPEAWSAFNWGDVLNVREDELAGFGQIGGNLTQRPNESGGLPNAFGPLSSPIIEPVTGAILPAPYKAAATLNYLRLTNPQFYQLALSAYANSLSRAGDPNARLGYSQAGLEAEMQQALPQGQEHGLIGLR